MPLGQIDVIDYVLVVDVVVIDPIGRDQRAGIRGLYLQPWEFKDLNELAIIA